MHHQPYSSFLDPYFPEDTYPSVSAVNTSVWRPAPLREPRPLREPTPLRPPTDVSTAPPPVPSRRAPSAPDTRYSRRGFGVRVEGATRHGEDGYVRIGHGRTYTLVLSNHNLVPCDAQVWVDGKSMGTFRIGTMSSTRLEGPPDEGKRFTFYEAGTADAADADIRTGDRHNGVIKVTFTPHARLRRYRGPQVDALLEAGSDMDGMVAQSSIAQASMAPFSARNCSSFGAESLGFAKGASWLGPRLERGEREGATGLSGVSDQEFRTVGSVPLDYSGAQRIAFRLISDGFNPNLWDSFRWETTIRAV